MLSVCYSGFRQRLCLRLGICSAIRCISATNSFSRFIPANANANTRAALQLEHDHLEPAARLHAGFPANVNPFHVTCMNPSFAPAVLENDRVARDNESPIPEIVEQGPPMTSTQKNTITYIRGSLNTYSNFCSTKFPRMPPYKTSVTR